MSQFPMLRSLYKEFWDKDFLRRLTGEDEYMDLFGDESFPSMMLRNFMRRPRLAGMSPHPPLSTNVNSFQVTINVHKFEAEELSVKTMPDNFIVIEGKQDRKELEPGVFQAKQFTRRYLIPDGVDPESITSKFMPGGYLTVYAPRKLQAKDRDVEIIIEEGENHKTVLKTAVEEYQKKKQEEGVGTAEIAALAEKLLHCQDSTGSESPKTDEVAQEEQTESADMPKATESSEKEQKEDSAGVTTK